MSFFASAGAKLIGVGVLLLAIAGAFAWAFSKGAQHERATTQEARLEQARIDAAISQRRVTEQARIAHDATVQADTSRAAAVAAGHARDALRVQLSAFLAHARAADPAASAAVPGVDGGDPIGVLADVLERADARADVVEKLADARRIAWEGCERSYDSLNETAAVP